MTVCDDCFIVMQTAVEGVRYERITTALDRRAGTGQLMKPAELAAVLRVRAGVITRLIQESKSLRPLDARAARAGVELLEVLAVLYASDDPTDKQLAYTLTARIGMAYTKKFAAEETGTK